MSLTADPVTAMETCLEVNPVNKVRFSPRFNRVPGNPEDEAGVSGVQDCCGAGGVGE